MKICTIVGIRKSGKTTTVEGLIRELKKRGHRVGTVKTVFCPAFSMDQEGSNTDRHKKAGADLIGVKAKNEMHMIYPESLNDNIMNYNVIMEVDNIATIKSLVANGFGSSVLSHSVCTQEIKKGKLVVVPIENLSIVREINIVYHKDFEYTDQIDQIRSIYTARMSSGL